MVVDLGSHKERSRHKAFNANAKSSAWKSGGPTCNLRRLWCRHRRKATKIVGFGSSTNAATSLQCGRGYGERERGRKDDHVKLAGWSSPSSSSSSLSTLQLRLPVQSCAHVRRVSGPASRLGWTTVSLWEWSWRMSSAREVLSGGGGVPVVEVGEWRWRCGGDSEVWICQQSTALVSFFSPSPSQPLSSFSLFFFFFFDFFLSFVLFKAI